MKLTFGNAPPTTHQQTGVVNTHTHNTTHISIHPSYFYGCPYKVSLHLEVILSPFNFSFIFILSLTIFIK